MFNGSNCDRKSQLSGILTEPLNPRAVYLSVSVSIYLCIYLSVYLSVSVSICLCFYLSLYISVSVYICLCIYLSVYLSDTGSICLCIYLSVYLSDTYWIYLSDVSVSNCLFSHSVFKCS